jgi:hypothetical protein
VERGLKIGKLLLAFADLEHKPAGFGKKSRRGVSEVTSTVILTAGIIAIVLSTFGYATYVLGIESASREFSQAQGMMVSFENLVEDLIFRPDSSAYIRFNFRTSGPSFEQTGGSVTLWISQHGGSSYTPLAAGNASIAVFRIRGGSSVGTADSNLVGDSSILLTDVSKPLGRVTVNQSQGAWINLDYGRVRVNYLGTFKFYNGSSLEEFNVVEVTYLNLTRGVWYGGNYLTISARNSGVLSYQLPAFDKGNQSKEITFTAVGGWPTPKTERVTLTELGGDLGKRTIVRIVFAKVVVTVGGG